MIVVQWISDAIIVEDVFDDVMFFEGQALLYKNGVIEYRINPADIVEMYRIGG